MTEGEITVYTDGAAKGNPGPGGFGVVMIFGNKRREISGGFRHTTNNRMELLAIIVALEAVKRPELKVKVYTDSKYVCDSVQKRWVWSWQKKGWKGKKNVDLWQRFLKIYAKVDVEMEWVKGHSGIKENERCDQLAVKASEGKNLKVDAYYEAAEKENNLFTK
jgi:ribonuclease HI